MIAWRKSPRFGVPEAYALIGLLSFLVARFLPVLELPAACPSRALLGLPCLTCGMTHAFVALAHGDVPGALAASPLGALLAGGAWLYAAADLARVAVGLPFPAPDARLQRGFAVTAAAALALNWAWLLSHGTPT